MLSTEAEGGYTISEKGVRDRQSTVGVSQRILPWKMLKIEVLGNGISGIPRPKVRVLCLIFSAWGFEQTEADQSQLLISANRFIT